MKKLALAIALSLAAVQVDAAQLHFIDQSVSSQQQAQTYLSDKLTRDYQFAVQRRGHFGTYYSFMPLYESRPVFNLVDSLAVSNANRAFRYYQAQISHGAETASWPTESRLSLAEIVSIVDKPLAQLVANDIVEGWWQTPSGLSAGWRVDLSYGEDEDRIRHFFIIAADKTRLLGEQGYVAPYQLETTAVHSGNDVTTWLFDPDPKTSMMSETLHTEYVQDQRLPQAAFRLVTLRDLTRVEDQLALTGPYVKVADFLPPEEPVALLPDAGPLTSEQDSSTFLQQMAYYHIDTAQRHLRQLGFVQDKAIHYQPMVIDAQGSSNDQSAYSFYQNRILLGIGGRPDAQDADVIWHEYAHSITHFINPFEIGGDSGAIGEGFADFFAGAHSYRDEQGKIFEPDVMFNWDARFGGRTPRTLNDVNAQYNANYYYPAHISVRGTLGDQLWSTPIFQSLKLAEQHHGIEGMDDVERVLLEAMYGLGAGVTMNQLALSTIDIAKRMYPNRRYSEDLQQQFAEHNLLPKFVNVSQAQDISALSGQDELIVSVTNISDTDLTNVTLTPVANDHFSLAPANVANVPAGASQQVTLPLAWLKTATCGADFSLEFDVGFNSAVPVISSEKSRMTMVVGQAQRDTVIGEGGVIKDASGTSGGAVTSNGVSTFYLDVTNSDLTLDKDFRVNLDFTHPDLQKISIELTSPSGRSVRLWNNGYYSQTHFDFELPSSISDVDLSVFHDEQFRGRWKLQIVDERPSQDKDIVAQLHRWSISQTQTYQCQAPTPNPPPTPAPEPTPAPDVVTKKSSSGGPFNPLSYLFIALLIGWRIRNFTKENI